MKKKKNKKKVVIFNLGECICLCCVNINMPIYKTIRTQLNNCALHRSCCTTNVEHRLIQLHLLRFCLGARTVSSPSVPWIVLSRHLRCFFLLFAKKNVQRIGPRGVCERTRPNLSERRVSRGVAELCFCFSVCFFPSRVVVRPERTLPARWIFNPRPKISPVENASEGGSLQLARPRCPFVQAYLMLSTILPFCSPFYVVQKVVKQSHIHIFF